MTATSTLTTRTSTRAFTYDASRRLFVGEISDTGLRQIWADSADLGLSVVSNVTGVQVDFVVTDEHRDADGDITDWTLASVTGTRQDGRFTMTLFND